MQGKYLKLWVVESFRKNTQITQNYDLIKIPGSFRILTEDMESEENYLNQFRM